LTDAASRRRAIERILPEIKHLDPGLRRSRAERIADAVGAELPDDLMMSEAQVRRMSDLGIEVGAHTVNHPILKSIPAAEARAEIAESRAVLRAITGRDVAYFAYPNGRPDIDYDASHVDMVRMAGFEAAVSTAHGAASWVADRHQLPRVALWGPSAFKGALRLAAGYRDRDYRRAAA
jgi:peptidoglycan/xylan/chitin deacetylase (PgdA/CDA1 family)